MDKLNGYRLLVIAARTTASTVWHYSTGNDAGVCERPAGANAVGYIDTEKAATLKGCCQACARYVGKHGDYQGWDSENGVRFLSITNPRPSAVIDAYKGGAFCAMHGKFISQCADQHNNDSDSGFRETDGDWFCDMHGDISERCQGVDHTPAKKSGFPVATQNDTNDHFMGSGATSWEWWDNMEYTYEGKNSSEVSSWEYRGIAGAEDDYDAVVILNHAAIVRTVRKISRLALTTEPKNRGYVSDAVIRECRTWVFKGPDECDFDAPMADEVMQYAAFGSVVYA